MVATQSELKVELQEAITAGLKLKKNKVKLSP
jgi:hypothetical protein